MDFSRNLVTEAQTEDVFSGSTHKGTDSESNTLQLSL